MNTNQEELTRILAFKNNQSQPTQQTNTSHQLSNSNIVFSPITTDPYHNKEELKQQIKTERLKQNKTQRNIARLAGVSQTTISRIEQGRTLSINTLLKIITFGLGKKLTII
jgi:DNA-binding XRE family transcriptional regulator